MLLSGRSSVSQGSLALLRLARRVQTWPLVRALTWRRVVALVLVVAAGWLLLRRAASWNGDHGGSQNLLDELKRRVLHATTAEEMELERRLLKPGCPPGHTQLWRDRVEQFWRFVAQARQDHFLFTHFYDNTPLRADGWPEWPGTYVSLPLSRLASLSSVRSSGFHRLRALSFGSYVCHGVIIDVGAKDGVDGSNSYFFERFLGWRVCAPLRARMWLAC